MEEQYQDQWHQFTEEILELIIFNKTVIELPVNRWEVLMQTLVNKVDLEEEESSETHREAAVESIGYICQDIRYGVLENQSNPTRFLWQSYVHGMRQQEPSIQDQF